MSTTFTSETRTITHYTAYNDDFIADDDLFNIFADTRLVLAGDDQLNNDTIAMSGQLRIRGSVEVNALTLANTAYLVNTDVTSETGDVNLGTVDADTAVVRNIPGAIWNVTASATISAVGAESRFVNLGLFEQTSSQGTLSIVADFYDRGGTVEADGTLNFLGPITRFISRTIDGGGVLHVGSVFLYDTNVFVGVFYAQTVTVRGTCEISSVGSIGAVQLQNAHLILNHLHPAGGGGFQMGLPNIRGNGTLTVQYSSSTSNIGMSGNTTLQNLGQVDLTSPEFSEVPGQIVASPGTNQQVQIINAAGATWNDVGNSGSDSFSINGSGTAMFTNEGGFDDYVAGGTDMYFDFFNDGVVKAWTDLRLHAAVTGSALGNLDIMAGGGLTLDNSVDATQVIQFAPDFDPTSTLTTTLTLNDVADFATTIGGFGSFDDDRIVVDTSQWKFEDFVANDAKTGGSLMFSDGVAEIGVLLLQNGYNPLGFHASTSGNLTTITYSAPT